MHWSGLWGNFSLNVFCSICNNFEYGPVFRDKIDSSQAVGASRMDPEEEHILGFSVFRNLNWWQTGLV